MNNWKWPGPALLFPYPTAVDDAPPTPPTTLERALLQLFAGELSALRFEPYQWPAKEARAWKWPTVIRARNDSGMSGAPVKTLFVARGPGGRKPSATP